MNKVVMIVLFSLVSALSWGQYEGERYYISENTKQLVRSVFPTSFANKILAYPITWSNQHDNETALADGSLRAWTDGLSYIKINRVAGFDSLSLNTYMHEVFHSWVEVVGDPYDLRKDYNIDRIRVALLDKRLNEEAECNLFAEYMDDLAHGYYNQVSGSYFRKFHPALSIK